ncbi:NUDIX domain-containing protein [Acidaminobacter sp. JC074]|uniref:NUDIX hydrolase n=1 Tax=Acidaminobacter sp. JC074 TaxID=2530199 RepID=UPI001F0EDBE8|nr:NUDIX domain-containing protein [Acidaminobacter sp. JC074]MCH4886164.1 NUDIX domain-containing protein [Acidaminobacter sp. JC074]
MNYIKYMRDKVGTAPINLSGAVTIIHRDKQILLQHRKNGKWGLIGGISELGESLEDTAKREAYEETGLSIQNLKLVATHSGREAFIQVDNGDQFYSVTICFETSDFSGDICVDLEESYEVNFFDYDDLPDHMVKSHLFMINKFLEKCNES